MRDRYTEICSLGADVIASGTGDQRYAAAFVDDENIPFAVFVDDDGAAARAAQVKVVPFLAMFKPGTWRATRETMKRGYKIHRAGKRVTQQGGTWIVGPDDRILFEHVDRDSTDHAPLDAVIAALQ